MKRHMTVITLLAAILVLAIAASHPRTAQASGDHWIEAYAAAPNTGHVLALPRGDFYNGLAEMASQPRARPWRVHDVQSTTVLNPYLDENGDPGEDTLWHDLADLGEALGKAGMSDEKAAPVLEAYRRVREPLLGSLLASNRLRGGRVDEQGHWVPANQVPVPPAPPGDEAQLAALPREFALYLAGARLWWQGEHKPDTRALAVAQWQALLDLPPAERHYRSVWAAYMLARTLLPASVEGTTATQTAPARAALVRTRQLAADGFSDSLGLATEATGWLGRLALDEGRPIEAVHLYYDMFTSGSLHQRTVAMTSLVVALSHTSDTVATARDPLARDLMSLWMACEHESDPTWLAAVRAAGGELPPQSAETLAWVAYNTGDLTYARELVRAAGPDSARGRWIEAKLLLYDGKVAEGTQLLASAARALEHRVAINGVEYEEQHYGAEGGFADGERALLLLGRGDYSGALEGFLRAGAWLDAAYVAERVMTVPELEARLKQDVADPLMNDPHYIPWYLDSGGGAEYNAAEGTGDHAYDGPASATLTIRRALDYLLARRLVRVGQLERARPHMPPACAPLLNAYAKHRAIAEDESQPPRTRALHYFATALIVRYRGMQIMGTEEEPDWRTLDGQFGWQGPATLRLPFLDTAEHWPHQNPPEHWPGASQRLSAALRPSQDELDRVAESAPSPNVRYHYRFVAAELGWRAAKLLSDNDPALPFVLWRSGTWIAESDDKKADKFYQALVSRCRKLPISDEADRLRWFPNEAPPMPDEIARMVDQKLAADSSRR